MVKLGSFSDCSTSSRIKDKLKTICQSGWEIEQKRVAVVKFRMNDRGGYGTRCGTIDGIADMSEVSNVIQIIDMIQTQQKYDQKKLDYYQR